MEKSKQLKLDYIREKIADLARDYETVRKDLKVEQDGPAKNQLKDRLDMIQAEMEPLEAEEKSLLEAESQSDSPLSIITLVSILDTHESQITDMKGAYRFVLAQRNWRGLSTAQTPSEFVRELSRIPLGAFAQSGVELFAAQLMQTTQETSLITALQTWGQERLGTEWKTLLGQLDQNQQVATEAEQSALLVHLVRSDEASTQSDQDTFYQVKAWFINDVGRYRAHQQSKVPSADLSEGKQGIIPLTLDDATGDETYALSTLPDRLPELIGCFLAQSNELSDVDPVLHFFLPMDLMNQAVDRWQLQDDYGGLPEAMGDYYPVVLRCAERLARNYRQRNLWKKKWQHHEQVRSQPAHKAFVSGDDQNLVTLKKSLLSAQDSTVGLKVLQAPNCDEPHKLFAVLLQAGMPCAIWGRENLTRAVNADELERVLQLCCLENVPSTVKAERLQAAGEPNDSHIGHHLSLLWDDPHLPPPRSA
ncbi:MAG: hypothetical protein AAF171_07380 [Cyanobacteria bacterium P01_A01_bin.116]